MWYYKNNSSVLWFFLPQIHNPSLEKYQKNPSKEHSSNAWAIVLKIVKIIKDKVSLRSFHSTEEPIDA